MYRETTLGIKISIVQADAQVLSGRLGNQADAIWLAMLIDGAGQLKAENIDVSFAPGDIMYGRTENASVSVANNQRSKFVFLMVPPLVFDPRLLGPVAMSVGHLPNQTSATRIFSNLLLLLTKVMTELTTGELRPIELSLSDFLMASIVSQGKNLSPGGADANRAAHLRQIQLSIEALLGNPKLSLKLIAGHEGVSVRYLQKLFSSSGQTVGNYIRRRRLERCRQDFENPGSVDLTITDICFRWGFSSSAHFSRAFREEYGVSPREFRARHVLAEDEI